MSPFQKFRVPFLAISIVLVLTSACSVQKLAVRSLGDALSGSAVVFASDNDPELVAAALPFALKTYEALLLQDPLNAELLLATCAGFTQFSQAFVELEAEHIRFEDHDEAKRLRERALQLYLRARDYCLRAIDTVQPDFSSQVRRDPRAAVAKLDGEHLPVLFWTGAAWGSAISVGRHRPDLLIDLGVVRAIFERALALEPDFDNGSLHEAMIAIESLPAVMGGSLERARQHYDRALELSGGQRASTHVAWAWQTTISRQDRAGFVASLEKALAVNVEARPAERMANIVNQRFARHLLDNVGEYFIEEASAETHDESTDE